jgi:LysM repeat protein
MTGLRPVALVRGLASLVVIVALAVGVPALLVAMIGNPVAQQWSWDQPLTNAGILGIVACVAWLFWAQFVVCVVVEVMAEVRIATGRSADWLSKVPGTFGGQQAFARTLVQAVVAVGITTSSVAVAPTPWTSHANAAAIAEPPESPVPAAAPVDLPSGAGVAKPKRVSTSTVEVRKGDTIWSIAETHLGAGERWREIAGLNHGRLMGDGLRFMEADRIRPGWVLLIPETAGESDDEIAIVRPGDTLWKIAEREYGDGDDWSRIFEANRAQIDDPDVIYSGQQLKLPEQVTSPPPSPGDTPAGPDRTRPDEIWPSGPPARTPSAEPTPKPVGPPERTSVVSPSDDDAQVLSTLARTLAGGGMLLAVCLAAAYATRRRAQFRVRRSGRTIPRTLPEFVLVESDLRSAGLAGAESVAFLDRALRDLSLRASRMPEVVAARLTDDSLELVLLEALKTAPSGWQVNGEGTRWRLPRTHSLGEAACPAPYPALVTLGLDPDGGTWLVDLEAAGVVQLRGPSTVCDDVVRFLAAELATNRWSDVVKVLIAGMGPDLVHLNPGRLELIEEVDLDRLVKKSLGIAEIRRATDLDVLTGRQSVDSGDAWNPLLILAATPASGGGAAAREFTEAREGKRSTTALVSGGEVAPGGLTIVVDEAGYATLPWAGRLQLNRLSADDAKAVGAAFASVEQLDDEPMPVGPLAAAGPIAGLADEAGALAAELTDPRPSHGSTLSLLPELDAAYVEVAATTEDDINVLAPVTRSTVENTVLAADPQLDADLAEWFADAVVRPQLRLLGPIELRVDRPVPDVARGRVAYLTEVAAYLSCHPGGVTSSQLADVFNVQANTIHKRMQELRDWLGQDPATGSQRLPEAKLSEPGAARGVGNYVLTGTLCDIDLFRRLRVRGQARGADGIEDLIASLRLVAGPPFDQQRANGYGWLASDSTDHHLTAGIVDVAHIVATAALASGDAERAAWAASQAILVAPFEDKPRLDYVAALEAMGHRAEAQTYLEREVFNRSDDDLAPPDPTVRVSQVAAQQDRRSGRVLAADTAHADQ